MIGSYSNPRCQSSALLKREFSWWEKFDQKLFDPEAFLTDMQKWFSEILDIVIQDTGIPSQSNLIDVGCGPDGIFQVLQEYNVTAIDPLLLEYERLSFFKRSWYPFVKFSPSTLEEYVADGHKFEFDLAFCINVLNHIADLKKAIRHLVSLVPQGGSIVVTLDTYDGFRKWIRWKFPELDPLHPHAHSVPEYLSLFEQEGCKARRVIKLDPPRRSKLEKFAVSQRTTSLGRSLMFLLAPSLSVTRTVALNRQASQNIVVFLTAVKGGVFSFNPSLSFTLSASPSRIVSLSRTSSLNIMAYLASVRSQDLSRQVNQAFYGSFQTLRTIGFARGADLSVQPLFSISVATFSGAHSFFVNIALSLGITMNPQRSTVLGRASSMLFAPSFLPTTTTGPYVIGGGVVGTTVETPMYRITATGFSVGSNLIQNHLTVDATVKVESLNGYSGYVVLSYRLVGASGMVLDSKNKTVQVMGGSSATVSESLVTSYFWDALNNDNMTFTLTATWQATNQTAPQVITSSFIPCPIVTGLRQYQYYLYLSLGLCVFGAILFYDEPRKRKKS